MRIRPGADLHCLGQRAVHEQIARAEDQGPPRTVAIFLGEAPPANTLEEVRGRRSERLALGLREIYVSYGDRMADSKRVIPAAKAGTARNMNTIAKLAVMAAASYT